MEHFDIAVVGMGPVGSTTTTLLAHNGLKVVTIERDPKVYALPRAVAMDGEVIRGFQRIGLGQRLADLMQPVLQGDRAGFANSKRQWLFGSTLRDFGGNGWPPLSMFDQPEVDDFLRNCASQHNNITTYSGYEFESFEDDGGKVSARIREVSGDAAINFSTNYLMACDGAASGIRRKLDIPWHDLGYDHQWLVIDVIVKPGHTLNRDTVQVCDPDRLATYVCTKDPYRRWEFKLNQGETAQQMLINETIHQLLDPWTPRDTYTIRRTAVYHFHAAIAENWRKGRIFLLGDAAHQTPPFLGQGMNSGMRDAFNIAWKLSLVLSGQAEPSLLDHYQAERAAHAEDLVQWAVDFGKLMEHLAATEAAQNKGLSAPKAAPEQESQSSAYGQGREAPPLRDGVVIIEQVSDNGSTGYLFIQPRVRDNNNQEFLFDELLGRGFAVVVRSEAELDLNSQSHAIIIKLNITITSLENLSEVRGHFDRLFTNASAVVVRPDRYVFGHTSESLNLNQLLERLAQQLHLTD